jgi:hypothetical protein
VSDSAWETWEGLRSSQNPDPIEVLKTVAYFRRYFSSIEEEAIRVARAQGRTWNDIGGALGRTRQAIWQRAGSRSADLQRVLEESWALSAEMSFQLRSNPLGEGWASSYVPDQPNG